MMGVLIILVVVGVGVSATTPREPKERHPIHPIVPILCGPNSHFERCSKICPPQDCSALIDPYWLCEKPGCKPECRCNDGFYRQNGTCISRDECLAQCGPLERYVAESAECQRTCANYKVTAPRSLCKPFSGCVCEEGRVRLNDNATGPCVLPKHCPPRRCPLHEHWQDCPSVCANETCISKSPTYKCLLPAIPLPCKGRCMCDKGYLRNHVGDCVPENHCPIKECPINEVWRCASMCPRDSCKRLESGFQCPSDIISVCIPACACKDGYLRNDEGICIPREKCPASLRCGLNEVAVECQAYLPQTCESVYTLYKPIKDPPCKPGCDCRPGYLRNKRNICVPSEYCPTVPSCKCGPNQEYKECGTSCEPSCSDLDNPPQVCTDVCVQGCFCKEGFLKDEHGNCVYPSQCPLPICNKPNEVAKDCGSYCEMRTCEDYNRTDISCPAVCVRGCFCRKGYVRNAYGVCIHPKKCPPKPVCLQKHEEYQSCGSSCPDNCDNYMNTDRICTLQCVAGCNCKKGYVRNLKDGTCIKPEQCPSKECRGDNEALNYCASYCPVTCANRYTQGDWACITLCREACDCIPGTLRNDTGSCVPVDQCTPPICRENEKYIKCGSACPITCDNYKNPPKVCTRQCVEDCFCKEGYVRNRFGRCVKPEDCEPTCPAGEKWNECSAHCQDTCENYNSSNRICTYQCQSGCVCETGTVRRKDGKCVRPTECTDKIICPIDEVYDPCSAHCEPTCENNGPDRACTAICKPGCRCGEGLVRRKDGKCVKLKDCQPTCPSSEHYDECNAHCEETCELHGSNITCLPYCTAGCMCNKGLVRRKDGQCVNLEDCSAPLCPVNEVYDPCMSPNCPPGKVCAQVCRPGCRCQDGFVRDEDGKCARDVCPANEVYDPCIMPNCPPGKSCIQVCRPGCRCKNGLVRDKKGKCVNPKCPVNERWVNCVISLCIALTCDQLGLPIACPGIIGPCDGGCVCVENYVRDSNNVCIPKQNCPSCNNDFNATSGCGNHCGRQCTDYKNPPKCNLPMPCEYNGCDCKKGFVWDIVTGQCLDPVDCPVPCKGDLYAEKVKCPNPCPATCARPTTAICPRVCLKEGCQCRSGFVLNPDGKCVWPENCPDNLGCNGDPNAQISSCVSLCEPTCGENHIFCPAVCHLGCKCKSGFILSKPGGICIKPEKCVNAATTTTEAPCKTGGTRTTRDVHETGTTGSQQNTNSSSPDKIICPIDEVYDPCSAHCEPTCENNGPDRACTAICKPGCRCGEGLVRRKDGKCVKLKECHKSYYHPTCPSSEHYDECNAHCEETCELHGSNITCLPYCNAGCMCNKGLVRRKDGQCVNLEDCSAPLCPVNEVYDPCMSPNCPPGKVCAQVCRPGCRCQDGFVRDEDGKCASDLCPANEVYDPCIMPKCPPGKSCIQVCSPGCRCKNGLVRDNKGKCVINAATTTTEAPCKTGGTRTTRDAHETGTTGSQQNTNSSSHTLILCPNDEIWIDCKAGYCKPQYCRDIGRVMACSHVGDPCPGGCICRKGLLRNENGVCIPENECPINKPCSDPNAIRKKCASHESCRATCSVPNSKICPKICIINGCECKKGYVLSGPRGKCTKIKDCPKGNNVSCNGDPNAEIMAFPPPCPSTCKIPNGIQGCLLIEQEVGCVCKPGYIKDDNDKCILPDNCKGGNPCGANGTFAWCKVNCPNNDCPVDDSRGIIACDPPYPCHSGCVCKLNYRRKSQKDNRCILSSDCPPVKCTRPNEKWSCCPSACLRENCEDVNNQPTTCNPLVLNCDPRCICKKGHFRNASDICVPAKDCPNNHPKPCDDPNAERVECAPAPSCRSTCATPNPSPCILSCAVNECVCKKGFVLSKKGGKCIPVDQCPKDVPCNGDSNAVIIANPPPCPSTCDSPNASYLCRRAAPPVACQCKDGLIKATYDGKCIKPEKCPGGNPCGPNSTFVPCKVYCSNSYCPVNDKPVITPCEPSYPCPSGCICKINYKRKSINDDRCILSSTCPPVKCTRPNELWDPCSDDCLAESCADVNNQPTTCNTLILNCQPQCVCKKGYFRNSTIRIGFTKDTCIPAKDCPQNKPCEDPNAERMQCAPDPSCRSTCATPNPSPCIEICAINQCVCKKGYVLSKKGGKCIPVYQCPKDVPCNGDYNAVIKVNPIPCPSTCSAPNASPWCKRYAPPVGCECKPGYLLNDKDKCIKPDQCPGGNPCGKNATLEPCSFNCPSYNCPVGDNTEISACMPPYPCPTGCSCKKGYKRKSSSDYTCILASDCPSNKCSDPNAERVQCALAAGCRATCANPNPLPCISQICIKNECVCKKGYVLSEKGGKCIPLKQCPPPPIKCKENEVYNPCRLICPPQTCESIYTSYNCQGAPKCEPGCDCISEYLRNGTANDPCIPSNLCPTSPPVCGINEHYEINRIKCDLTCKNYHLEPIMGPCQPTSACFCDDGYVRNSNGLCIPKKKCPKNLVCPPNEVVSECYNSCLKTCKTRLRSDGRMCHLACIETGCVCKEGYLRHDNGTCVPISQCSPPRCNDNETYSKCGTACPPTCQNRGDNCTACTKQCVEDCFCNKGLVRSDDGSCIKPNDCPPRVCGCNEIFNPCPPTCPPTENCSNMWSKFNCTNAINCCKPQCRCKSGYLRKNQVCVPTKLCLNIN